MDGAIRQVPSCSSPRGRQWFSFYERVSTEDWQDPITGVCGVAPSPAQCAQFTMAAGYWITRTNPFTIRRSEPDLNPHGPDLRRRMA